MGSGPAVKVLLWLLLLEICWGCGANRVSQWPLRGGLVCIENQTADVLDYVMAEDDVGRRIVIAQKIRPFSRAMHRWPFVSNFGRLLAGNRVYGRTLIDARYTTAWFDPWGADRWRWTVTASSFGEAVAQGQCP